MDGTPDTSIEEEQPVPADWRPTLHAIVSAFVDGDYALARGVPGVAPVPPATADHIAKSIDAYGATLVELPEESWETSCIIWTGAHWDVLVDLWTQEEGRSDLVLGGQMAEDGSEFAVHMVYVP